LNFKILIIATVLAQQVFSAGQTAMMADYRDGKRYETVKIGTQTWMAENLNYDLNGSICYGNNPANCAIYGGLYNWERAMKACPSGWHLPTKEEWEVMTSYIGGAEKEGKRLKAANGWNRSGWSKNGIGTDSYNFSALPGGSGNSGGSFYGLGSNGYWWSSSESSNRTAYRRFMHYLSESAIWKSEDKNELFSVRCLKN